MASAYRCLDPVIAQRIGDLQEGRARHPPAVDAALRLGAWRVGRTYGGAVGALFGLASLGVGLAAFANSPWSDRIPMERGAMALLLLGWPVAVLVALAAAGVARAVFPAQTRVVLTGHPELDLAVLQARDPLTDARAIATRWERPSLALPLAAVAMLSPLTLHVFAMAVLSGQSSPDFGGWIGISALLVGHAHLALVAMCVRWTGKLRVAPTATLRTGLTGAWLSTLTVTVGAACVPGVVLVAVPPLLVAVTGLLFVPLAYHLTARTLQRERTALEAP